MKIYVINLETSADRRDSVLSFAQKSELDIAFVAAVDGRKANPIEALGYNKTANRREYGRLLSAGEVGCYASHLKIARTFLNTSDSYCAVLEDDAAFGPEFKDFLTEFNAAQDMLPANLKLVNIGNSAPKNLRSNDVLSGTTSTIALHETFRFPTTTRGLIWSRQGAEYFVKHGATIAKPVDHFLKDWLTRNPGGYCLPAPIIGGANFPTAVGTGTGRRELNWREAIRHDIARGKRDIVNDYRTIMRKYLGH